MRLFKINADLEQLKGNGYTSIPKMFNHDYYAKLFQLFDRFIDLMDQDQHLLDEYLLAGRQWKSLIKNDNLYSNFFTPYYRDRRGNIGLDEKVIFQTCESFHTFLSMSYPGMYIEHTIIGELFDKLMHIILANSKHISKVIYDMAPDLQKRLMPRSGDLPVSIRILRYEKDAKLSTSPHIDKTAFTTILSTSDPQNQQRLIVHNREKEKVPLSGYSVPKIHEEDNLLFFGAAFEEAGYNMYKALAHAVLPFENAQQRYSIILFWHFPDLDMSKFSTKVEFIDDLKLKRNGTEEM